MNMNMNIMTKKKTKITQLNFTHNTIKYSTKWLIKCIKGEVQLLNAVNF